MTLQVAQIGLAIDVDKAYAPAPIKPLIFIRELINAIRTKNFTHMIEWVTGSRAYHCVIAVTDHSYIGAEPGGARIRQEGDPAYPTIIWSDLPLTARQRYAITSYADKQKDKPYAYLDDLIIGLSLLFKNWPQTTWLWALVEKRLANDDQWQCAELADMCWRKGGIHVFRDNRLPSAVFPGSFEPVFKTYGWWPAVWS